MPCAQTALSPLRDVMPLAFDEPMAVHTTFGIGGPADVWAAPRSEDELMQLLAVARREGVPVLVVGRGSNLLVSDKGIRGLVIHVGDNLADVAKGSDTRLRAGAGLSLARLAQYAKQESLAGLAFAHGIPGTLGGAIRMNAGAYGGEMRQVVASTRCWDGENVREITGEQHEFSYRHSVFTCCPSWVILSADIALVAGSRADIEADMAAYARSRRHTQPLEWPSAGSIFKRPPDAFAGTTIDACGLKGFQIGGARVSDKHAGFIVNQGGATAADVDALIRHIQRVVFERNGIRLETELLYVGEWDEPRDKTNLSMSKFLG